MMLYCEMIFPESPLRLTVAGVYLAQSRAQGIKQGGRISPCVFGVYQCMQYSNCQSIHYN